MLVIKSIFKFIQDWSPCIQALCACIALMVAIKGGRFACRQLRDSALSNLLTIELEIKKRDTEIDDITIEYSKVKERLKNKKFNRKNLEDKEKTLEKKLKAAREDYLNLMDRFCYCISKGYFKDMNWKTEYKDYISSVVENNEEYFGINIPYENIQKLYTKWK